MQEKDWDQIKYFSMDERWGDASKMNPVLIQTLDKLRDKIEKPISIHCGYERRNTGGQHTLGNAVDCHCNGLSLVDFFLEASRFPEFKGIGVYPLWNNPGLHLDVRNKPIRAIWGCVAPKQYVDLNRDFFMNIITL